jgi:hypothetical protein
VQVARVEQSLHCDNMEQRIAGRFLFPLEGSLFAARKPPMEASGEDARHHAKEIEHASVSVGDIGPTLSRGSDLRI